MSTSAKGIDNGFIVADHRTKWSGNQMQFVLDYEIWRIDIRVFHAEQRPRVGIPRQQRKLVHSADEQGWRARINILVDNLKRQALATIEFTIRVFAYESHAPRS